MSDETMAIDLIDETGAKARLAKKDTVDAAAIEAKIAARIEARRQKNFVESERIRDELVASGILLEDGPGGTTWRRK